MSLFPRTFISSDPSFHPLFRLLDDFDTYRDTTTDQRGHHRRGGNIMKSFTPKFDVKELPEAYELYGELPGVEQKNVEIEFTDSQTLIVRGRTERTYTSGTPPAGFVEGSKSAGAIEQDKSHQPSVEDEADDKRGDKSKTSSETQVTKKQEEHAEPDEKIWVSERSVGEFSRSFTFPVRVDSDNVQASMKDGILSIKVPKAKKDKPRKINIS
jgi:HSP20 family molecular chaperone IbpA